MAGNRSNWDTYGIDGQGSYPFIVTRIRRSGRNGSVNKGHAVKSDHKGFYNVATERRNIMDKRRASDHQIDNDPLLCEYRSDFMQQCERIDKFMEDVEPLMAYVRAEINRNERRSEMYLKITENVLGAGVLSIFGAVGFWLLNKIKLEVGLK